ncbi:MAG TPA: translation initiation factor IF-2, partial [Cyclobacteriaceae bacterium]|nr:translation initiation factor IF-2 [Cyclobacteriaceae bacterium]
KLTAEQFAMLSKEFASSASEKAEASGLTIGIKLNEPPPAKVEPEVVVRKKTDEEDNVLIKNLGSKEIVKPKEEPKTEKVEVEKPKLEGIKVIGKIELDQDKKKPKKEEKKEEKVEVEAKPEVKQEEKKPVVEKVVEPQQPELETIKAKADKLQGLKVVDKIALPVEKKKEPVASSDLNN